MTAAREPYVAPLRGIGSTAPTTVTARPVQTAPPGWSCSRAYDGSEQWTWVHDEVPLVSVLVSPAGIAPVHIADPCRYRLEVDAVERAAQALAALMRFLVARGPRGRR